MSRLPQTPEWTVSNALVTVIRELGVRYVFGVSGANIEHLHDALFRLGHERVHSILCKTEMGAAFMADGYARQGQPFGVCCATSGGGAMNLVPGIAEARASGVPVLALVGCPTMAQCGQGAFQDMQGGQHQVDGLQLWQSVAKHAVVLRADTFWDQLETALLSLVDGHPGPSVLLLHRDVMVEAVADCPTGWWARVCRVIARCDAGVSLPGVSSDTLNIMAHAWASAQRPAIIAGPDFQNIEALPEFAQAWNIPVATTLETVTAFPQSHSHYLGVVGVSGHGSCHDYLSQCDLVWVLGCDLDLMSRAPIAAALQNIAVTIVHSNTQAVPESSAWTVCEAPAVPFLHALHESLTALGLTRESTTHPWSAPALYPSQRVHESLRTVEGLSNSQAIDALQPFLPAFDQVLMDAGNCAATAAHRLSFPKGVSGRIALGMGGMGYAVCAAMGAQLAQPQGHTLVLCGDGAMLMTATELHTAIELGLPMLWIVFNDSQHGMCTTRQRSFFDGRITSTRYSTVDFTTMVQGLAGDNPVWLGKADTADHVSLLLDDYLSHEARMPGVLELSITVEEVPPFYPLMSSVTAPVSAAVPSPSSTARQYETGSAR